jgi:hypothetical protein
LKDAAIDGFDMFLLALAEDELSLTQLVEMAPRGALEAVRHVLHLRRLGLLQIDFDSFDEQLLLVRAAEAADMHDEALDHIRTLRPPPKRSGPEPVPVAQVTLPSTGIRPRPSAPPTPRAKLRHG